MMKEAALPTAGSASEAPSYVTLRGASPSNCGGYSDRTSNLPPGSGNDEQVAECWLHPTNPRAVMTVKQPAYFGSTRSPLPSLSPSKVACWEQNASVGTARNLPFSSPVAPKADCQDPTPLRSSVAFEISLELRWQQATTFRSLKTRWSNPKTGQSKSHPSGFQSTC